MSFSKLMNVALSGFIFCLCISAETYAKSTFEVNSTYLVMRDGVMIATDYYLPKPRKAEEKFPTILYQTRYVRSVQPKFPFSLIKNHVLTVISEEELKFFISNGYAVVVVDARGSGASTGLRTMEFSPEEVKDGAEIADWIVAQPWSNGKIGTTGVSYVGTTAEWMLINHHPAVKACVPRSAIFDLYGHILFPGGIAQGPFVKVWGETTQALDLNSFSYFGSRAKRLVKGIKPVKPEDRSRDIYEAALSLHPDNFDVYSGLATVECRDDVHTSTFMNSDHYSLHTYRDQIAASGVPIFRVGGWYDGALSLSVIEGFWNTPNTEQVLLGPWDHGPRNHVSPFANHTEVRYDVLGDILAFFDRYLKDNRSSKSTPAQKRFQYYTLGEEVWKVSDVWPPAHVALDTLYFSADRSLQPKTTSIEGGKLTYWIDPEATTGSSSRWNSLTPQFRDGDTRYGNRAEQSSKLLHFTTAPFITPATLTGHPMVEIQLETDAADAFIFCYIEDVAPNGEVYYVTEGMLRAGHRAAPPSADYKQAGAYYSFLRTDLRDLKPGETYTLRINFLPISYQFKPGHRLRISMGGSDVGHFDVNDSQGEFFNIFTSSDLPGRLFLPLE